jgi:hypothetical protein
MSRDTVPLMLLGGKRRGTRTGTDSLCDGRPVWAPWVRLSTVGVILKGLSHVFFCSLKTVVKVYSARIRCLLIYFYLFLVS